MLLNPLPELAFPDAVRVNTGAHYLWTGYVLGNLPFGTAGPLVIVRFNVKDRWDICGVLRRDLDYLGTSAGKETIDIRPEDIFVLRAASSTAPPPITPLPVEPEPPPEAPLELEPEPLPMTDIKMTIVTGPGLPLIVGNWLEAGKTVELEGPDGLVVKSKTGSKLEFGPGGFEAGYATKPGDYILQIDGHSFTVPMAGKFTKLAFERTGGPTEPMVRLVSTPMSRSEAGALLAKIELAYPGTGQLFEVQ